MPLFCLPQNLVSSLSRCVYQVERFILNKQTRTVCTSSWLTLKPTQYLLNVLVAQSCLTLCNPSDCSPPGSSVHGILQARILEWIATPSSGDLPDPGIEPETLMSSALAGRLFTTRATCKATDRG